MGKPEMLAMINAQLDLGAAINYAIGYSDEFYVPAAVETIKELSKLTGNDAGLDAIKRFEDES